MHHRWLGGHSIEYPPIANARRCTPLVSTAIELLSNFILTLKYPMDKMSADKSLEFYLDTLGYLDEKYVSAFDEELEFYILEELDVDAHTFLHHNTVNLLIDKGLIPDTVANDSANLRTLVIELIDQKRNANEIRFDNDWITARQLAKKILSKIKSFQGLK
jgi:hypothetical protein